MAQIRPDRDLDVEAEAGGEEGIHLRPEILRGDQDVVGKYWVKGEKHFLSVTVHVMVFNGNPDMPTRSRESSAVNFGKGSMGSC